MLQFREFINYKEEEESIETFGLKIFFFFSGKEFKNSCILKVKPKPLNLNGIQFWSSKVMAKFARGYKKNTFARKFLLKNVAYKILLLCKSLLT